MPKGVQQFHHGMVIKAAGTGEQKAHDHAGQADHAMQLEAEVLERFAATHAILSRARKVDFRLWPACHPCTAQELKQ